MTTPPPPREEDDEPATVPDEVWEKFVNDNRGSIRATAPKEPSARARMVTERLRREDAERAERERASRRRFGRGRRPQEPAGWRTGPAWQEMRRAERGPWRGRLRAAAVVVVVAVVALVAINPSGARSLVHGHWHSPGSNDTASGDPSGTADHPAGSTPLAPETAAPTAPPPAVDPDMPTVSHPFAGSPALDWAEGAAAIELPHATAVGGVTAKQVATALQATKAYLVATNLDPAELRGGYPTAALSVLDPINGEPAVMKGRLRAPSEKKDPTVFFTRYDPKEVRPVGTVVKVRGRTTFAAADHGAVRVHTDYSFVYAFTEAGDPDGAVARLVVRRVVDTEWLPHAPRGKVQLVLSDAFFGGAGCGPYDGYLHPLPVTARTDTPSGPATDPYDRSKPIDTGDRCGVASRV
jgi:hypothetical protein